MVHKGKKVRVKDGKIEFYLDTPYVSRNRPFYATIPVKQIKEGIKAINNITRDDRVHLLYCPEVVLRPFPPYLKLRIYKNTRHIIFIVEHPFKGEVHRHRFDYIDVLEALTGVSNEEEN